MSCFIIDYAFLVGHRSCSVTVCAIMITTGQRKKKGAKKEPDSVVNNNQLIIWPKGAPASFEVGLSSMSDEVEQLKCSEDNK